MTHPLFRPGLALAGAILTLAVAIPAGAKKDVQLPTISVEGVDQFCDHFTATTTSNGGTVLTCVPAGGGGNPPPAGAPQGCIAQVNGTAAGSLLPNTGGNANLSVTCSSPAASSLSFNWSRNGTPGASTSASWTDTPTSNPALGPNTSTTTDKTTSYQVTVCTGSPALCATVPSSPLQVVVPKDPGGGGGPPPSGAWNGVCTGFTKTLVIPMSWSNPQRMFTSSFGSFGPNDAVVLRFTTGNLSSSSTSLPSIQAAEYGSSPSTRLATLSDKPCDFGPQPSMGANIESKSVTLHFAVGTGNNWGFYPSLKLNTEYFVNIKNAPGSDCGVCDIFINLIKAGGL